MAVVSCAFLPGLFGCEPTLTKSSATALAKRKLAAVHHDSLRADSVVRAGLLLPGARIVAFYGNPAHKAVGILG